MGATKPLPTLQDIASASDEDLIGTYCADHERSDCANALWQRYEPTVRTTINRMVFSTKLCPPGWKTQTFYESCLSRVYLEFLDRICRNPIRKSVDGWFHTVARSTVFQERRDITHKRKPDKKQVEKRKTEGTPYLGEREMSVGDSRNLEPFAFRSTFLTEEWLGGSLFQPQDKLLALKERKRIVLRLLILHAYRSEEGCTSARSLRLRYWCDWKYAQIGAALYGPPWSDRERNRHEVDVRRLLIEDLERLHVLMRESFGIAELRHI